MKREWPNPEADEALREFGEDFTAQVESLRQAERMETPELTVEQAAARVDPKSATSSTRTRIGAGDGMFLKG